MSSRCCCPAVVTVTVFLHQLQEAEGGQLLGNAAELVPVQVPEGSHTNSHFRTQDETPKWLLAQTSLIFEAQRSCDQEVGGADPRTHSSVRFRGRPLGRAWSCLLLQRTTESRQVHWLGHWGPGPQRGWSWAGPGGGAEVRGRSVPPAAAFT